VPVYQYEVLDQGGEVVEVYEAFQGINDPALTAHPVTGEAMRRIIGAAPSLSLHYTDQATRTRLREDKLQRAGFTQYVRDKGTGRFHRTFGEGGPEVVDPGSEG